MPEHEPRHEEAITRTRPRFFSPCFIATGMAFIFVAVGLHPAVGALSRRYEKEEIAIRRRLETFDDMRLRSFERLPRESWMVVSEWTGTDEYLMRLYRPTFAVEGLHEASRFLLFVTYYSDPRDQVPHTPEVCYRQGGSEVRDVDIVSARVPGLEPSEEIEARWVTLDNPGHRSYILYVFCHNGKVYHDRESVRFAIGIPGDKHVYFAKIEAIGYPKGDDHEAVAVVCERLLGEALIALLADHFPTREALAVR